MGDGVTTATIAGPTALQMRAFAAASDGYCRMVSRLALALGRLGHPTCLEIGDPDPSGPDRPTLLAGPPGDAAPPGGHVLLSMWESSALPPWRVAAMNAGCVAVI